ncbi:hypothetical protein L208DRAFT_1245552 [Tricholoma matsutake]|nr:hypothetical protein L208DRAFT_1245552 [Tricholoma matsutake 945]
MTKIVNSVSAKMEMGSLMICMYFLGNPDHYKSHKFPSFYWQSFVQECQRPWMHTDAVLNYIYCSNEINCMCLYEWISRCKHKKKPTDKRQSKHSQMSNLDQNNDVNSEYNLDSKNDTKSSEHSLLSFQDGHPMASSHGTQCHSPMKSWVPNFLGTTLPCFGQGDHEYYCCTMLTLFSNLHSPICSTQICTELHGLHMDYVESMLVHTECAESMPSS